MVGQTEETLTANRVSYEVGIAKYSELAKSMMLGDEAGMPKLLLSPETHKLLGAHAFRTDRVQPKSYMLVRPYSSTAGRLNISGTWSLTVQRSPKLTR